MEILCYTAEHENIWNDFIRQSADRLFLLFRGYIDYHSDRFTDHSLLFYDNQKLLGVLPANIEGDVLNSHGGLTYGGIVFSPKIKTEKMGVLFKALCVYAKKEGIKKLIYKPVPSSYRYVTSEEDLYVLFVMGAKTTKRDISSCINLKEKFSYRESKKRAIKKAIKNGVDARQTNDFETYYGLLESTLKQAYGVTPVHSYEEISLLAKRFPENIKLFSAYKDNQMLAGIIVYEYPKLVHLQYIAVSEIGKEFRALDFLTDYLINQVYLKSKDYFEFGKSTEDGGRYLNKSLISYKEGFGARAICYDTYEVTF